MARIFKKIVYNFDYKWMRILFHEPDLVEYCLVLSLVQEFHRTHRPFDSEYMLIMNPDGPEYLGKATCFYKVSLVSFKQVGVFALLGRAKRLSHLYNILSVLLWKANRFLDLYTLLIAFLGKTDSFSALYTFLISHII